ncbi:hypothetical protein Taro_035317 [Colocasia esculenta]|uniref:Uncharacterized protein n=1 Tax=Colocasia esculenta TaxID=4460 RepID=A0A843W066_COLES|nr:hypothetical protein [Colocasia esculenta]
MALQVKNRGVLAFPTTGLDQAIEELENNCRIHKNEEIKKLITKMKHNIAVLKDAEKKQISSEVHRFWLGKLKEVAFDAEDLIDELVTDAAVQSMGAHTYSNPTMSPSMMGQIHDMNSRLDDLEHQIDVLAFQLPNMKDSCPVLPTWRQTGSLLPDESSVIGRDGEKEKIIKILLSDQVAESINNNNKSFSIVPIVGLGGMGKTTLAQLVYNDEKVEKHFELMMWVCVSNNPDRERLTKEMIEAAFVFEGKHEKCDITNWDTVQQRLLRVVKGKTFLLVLDDVWDAKHSMWEELFRPLYSGEEGSKILVTARNMDFVNKLEGPMEAPIPLGGLSDVDVWDVFKKYAFREYVSRDDCFKLEDRKIVKIPDTVHHVSVGVARSDQIDIIINELRCYEKLRTLLFIPMYGFGLSTSDLDHLFLKFKSLRVLGLSKCGIGELPTSIGDLKHLRYLDLERNYGLTQLPESLGNLYNLQVLNLSGRRPRFMLPHTISRLPTTMSRLVNLKHLGTYDRGLLSCIDGVGKLTGLQELQVTGRQVRELGGMCMLRKLTIFNLEEVGSKEEAIRARLQGMECLRVLKLEWTDRWSWPMNQDSIKPELEGEVLQALQPNKGITELDIEGYGGIKSPDWMEVSSLLSSFSSLRRVSLFNCPNWQVRPCSFLSQLHHLQYLRIVGMPKWKEWSCHVSWNCLLELTIEDCPRLSQLPLLPRMLSRIRLNEVGVSGLPVLDGCSRVGGGIETTSPRSPPPVSASLSKLHISYCGNLRFIGGLLLQHLPDLEEIEISNCYKLVSLPEKGFGHLVSLKRLKIIQCPKITCLLPIQEEEEDAQSQHLPCSLEELEISECGDAMGGWWWAGLQRLTSITKLTLSGCPSTLAELLFLSLGGHRHPHLPVTLKEPLIDRFRCDNYEQQSTTSSSGSSQLTPPPTLPPIPHNNVDASAGVLRALTSLKKWGGCGLPSSLERLTCWHDLISLNRLTLVDCINLRSLSNLSFLPSLQTLHISDCPSIETLQLMSLPSSLQSLALMACKNLHFLSISLSNCLSSIPTLHASMCPSPSHLSSLQTLHISDCPSLQSLPETLSHLHSLRTLKISFCRSIQSWPASDEQSINVEDPLKRMMHGHVPTDDHIRSSHSMHAVLSTLLVAAIVWEIWLSRNHAIYEASGMMPFAHSMGKASVVQYYLGVVFKSALNVIAASIEMRRWLATNFFLVILLWLFGLILVISLACKKMPLQVSYLLLLAASSTYGLRITLSLISAFAVLVGSVGADGREWVLRNATGNLILTIILSLPVWKQRRWPFLMVSAFVPSMATSICELRVELLHPGWHCNYRVFVLPMASSSYCMGTFFIYQTACRFLSGMYSERLTMCWCFSKC